MQEMSDSYELHFEDRPGYLYARVEGPQDSLQISRSYWLRIAGRVREQRSAAVLIEENIDSNGTMAEAYELASEIPKMGFGDCKVAFFDRYLDHNEVNEFAELVATNRGLTGRVFNDYDEALSWLLDE